MKTKIVNVVLALGCALGIAAVSNSALAHHCYTKHVYAYQGSEYHRYSGHHPFYMSGDIQGRPVKNVHGNWYVVRHCNSGYWHHHVWHRPSCA